MDGTMRITCRITGRVQMVMFRDFTQRKARKLGLSGFTHNENDGSVTVVAEGSKEKLETYLIYLHKGSVLSRVNNIEATWGRATNEFRDFSILY